MTKEEFIRLFVIQFLSTWTVKHYDEYCSMGIQERLENPPVEDAFYLAEKTWEKVDNYKEL